MSVEREDLWQLVWKTLASHQWGNWECSCGGVRKGSGEYEDNHLADVLADALAVREQRAMAGAWEQGHVASERDWRLTFDITTPDEERIPLTNPYREGDA